MIKISKQNNSLIVEGIDNVFYPNNGDNSYPLNSLIVVTDNSEMATFRSVATNDVLFSGLINNITINGESVTKDNIIQKFDAVSNSSTGGGGGGTVDAYTKSEADAKFASKDELTNVQTVANDADTKVDALTPRVQSVETAMDGKQPTLVSGTNIKTINNQSILGEGNLEISGGEVDLTNYYTKPEADEKFATTTQVNHQAADISALQTDMRGKQATLVSGENIKTVNSQSILGEGNIEVSGGIKTYEASEMPTNFKDALYQAVYEAYYTLDKTVTINKSTDVEEFLSNLKTGDYLQVTEYVLIQYYGTTMDIYKFAIKTGKEPSHAEQYGRLITVWLIGNMFYIKNNASGPVLQKNDLKTINGEEIVGSGNIEVSGVSEEQAQEIAKIPTLETDMMGKQATLVSGENIKTVNSQSILGSGDLTISGVSDEQAQGIAKIPTIEAELAQKANVSDVPTVQTKQTGGTDKNYIYSDYNHKNKLVFSKFLFRAYSASFLMEAYPWGENENYVETYNLPLATTTAAGVMSAADKTKLDSIPETIPSQSEIDGIAANVSALETAMDGKQPTLVSGTNIKTINGNNILGEGNLVIEGGDVDLSNYYNKTEVDTKLDAKQNTLVSGTNIKTVNSQSILGEGNLEVTIPDATTATSGAMSAADKTKLDSMSNEWTGTQAEYDALTTKDNNTIYYVTE